MLIDRRSFVKTGAGAAIGASLWPGALTAEDVGESFSARGKWVTRREVFGLSDEF